MNRDKIEYIEDEISDLIDELATEEQETFFLRVGEDPDDFSLNIACTVESFAKSVVDVSINGEEEMAKFLISGILSAAVPLLARASQSLKNEFFTNYLIEEAMVNNKN